MAVIPLALGVNPTDIDENNAAKVHYVEDGAMIRGFSLGLRCYNETGVVDSNSTVILLRKNEAAIWAPPGLAQMNGLGAVNWKNRVFHIEQAITGSQVSGWPMAFPSIKIPKRFHKMSKADTWELIVANNTGNNLRICGVCTYKWYR